MNENELRLKLIHAFSNPIRIQILELLKVEPLSVGEIVTQVKGTQSNISQHLACLRGCGLVEKENVGKFVYYKITNDKIKTMLALLDGIVADIHTDLETCEYDID